MVRKSKKNGGNGGGNPSEPSTRQMIKTILKRLDKQDEFNQMVLDVFKRNNLK